MGPKNYAGAFFFIFGKSTWTSDFFMFGLDGSDGFIIYGSTIPNEDNVWDGTV